MTEEKNILNKEGKRVEQLIFSDDLTGAFNRRYLYQYLPHELERCKIDKQGLWLFMIDVDNFKQVNDTYGHLRGDEVLKGIVETLKESVRAADTVIRYAGDEFTIIVSSADSSTADAVAKRIMSKISSRDFKSENDKPGFKINLSIGIANFPDDASDTLRLIDMADKALYSSKQKGKNRISYVSDLPSEMLIARAILEIFPCPKLIEREKQFNELKGVLEKVKNEKKAHAVLISGAAGTGKSRLLDEFLKFSKAQGFTGFLDRCSERTAFSPFRSALSSLEKYLKNNQIKKEVFLGGITAEELAALMNVLPILKMLFGLKENDLPEIKDRMDALILNALVKAWVNISKQSKFCIVIDDFQWIDIGSLNLISVLKEQEAQLLLCFLLREEEFSRSPTEMPLVQFKDDLDRFFSAKIGIENLSFQGTKQMLMAIFSGLEKEEEFVNLIHKISQGNPLFIEELLKFMVQKGFIFYQKGKWSKIDLQDSDLPHTLEDVILERIKSLEKPAQEIIARAAVIGQDFNPDILHRMGQEDEGYILDILESAKKAGLIRDSIEPDAEVPSGEKMSFVNEEIRKAVSDLVGKDEIKKLHLQVGEIEEKLNADNLGSIADELSYHFNKAEDYERAKRYARMLKDAEGLLQDRTMEYARQLLGGKEERVNPLSKKSQKLIPEIVRLLYIISINVSLYPQGSEMITSPLDDLFKKFSEIFARDQAVFLSEYRDVLIFNGEKLKDIDIKSTFFEGLLTLLREHNLESISFRKGLSKNELIMFLENLVADKGGRSLSEILRSKFIFKIKINEIDYVSTDRVKPKGGDELAEATLLEQFLGKGSGGGPMPPDFLNKLRDQPQEAAHLLNRLGETAAKDKPSVGSSYEKESLRADAVVGAINKIGESITASPSGEIDKYKKGLATTIMGLEPKLRKDVLLNEMFRTSRNDIIKEISPFLSDEVITDIFVEELGQKKASGPRLKNLLMRFISDDSKRKHLLPILKNKLESLGLSHEDSAWIFGDKKWQDFKPEERLSKFLQMSAQDYLSFEDEVDVRSLYLDIVNQGHQEPLSKFLAKWQEFFRQQDVGLRKLLALNFANILEATTNLKQEFLNAIIDFILSQIQKETQPEIYAIFVEQLAIPIDCLLVTKHFLGIKSVLERLEKERSRFSDGVELSSIQAVYERIFEGKYAKIIIEELLNRIDKNIFYSDIAEIIILIGEVMVNPLIDEAMIEDKQLSYLGYFGVYLRRRAIGEVLAAITKNIGYEIIADNLRERLNSNQWLVVKNAVDLVMYIQEPKLCGLLSELIRHPDIEVRKKVTLVLAKLPNPGNLQSLHRFLQDSDADIRLNVINLLGKIGDRNSLDLLKNLNDPGYEEAIQAAINALEKK